MLTSISSLLVLNPRSTCAVCLAMRQQKNCPYNLPQRFHILLLADVVNHKKCIKLISFTIKGCKVDAPICGNQMLEEFELVSDSCQQQRDQCQLDTPTRFSIDSELPGHHEQGNLDPTIEGCRVLSLSNCRYSLNPLSQTRIDWVGRYRIRWTFKLSYA